MKKILLINPVYQISAMKNANPLALPPIGLLILANLTPDHYEVQIIDEAYQDVDFDADVDLVGITAVSHVVSRAYHFATEFKKRNIPVVMGGVHVSYEQEEALQYADAIVVGEAEEIWPILLQDFEKGELKQKYIAEKRPDISRMKPLNRKYLKGKYFVDTVQTTRGCPHRCRFCSVPSFNGAKYRYRDLDLVLEEVASIKNKHIFFVDDNIIGYSNNSRKRALELFHGLKGMKKEWAAQSTIDIAGNDKLLKAARDSGGRALMVGFESINEESLSSMNKKVNLKFTNSTEYYKDAVKKIQDHGISIVGSFIFGQDHDDPHTVERTLEFIKKAEIDAVQLCILTPLPGTELFEEFKRDQRLTITEFPRAWDAYNMFTITYEPRNISQDDLYLKIFRAYKEVSSFYPSLKRGIKTFSRTKSGFNTGISFFWNHGIYKTLKAVPELKEWTDRV